MNVHAEDQIATKTVVVIGTGKIYKKDSASARKTAIENSLISAVENVALGLIPPESLNQTFQSFNEALYAQTGSSKHAQIPYEMGDQFSSLSALEMHLFCITLLRHYRISNGPNTSAFTS